MSHTILSKKLYCSIFAALLALTLVTVMVAMIDLGPLNTPLALGIAGLKATLVILYFMHVRYSSRLTWMFVGAGFFWLGILLALTLSDFLSRGWLPGYASSIAPEQVTTRPLEIPPQPGPSKPE
ncbi:MAG: cytochrome C oxidase subunit IV family protein [Acidobacteria bacterium]|nr:cytochrome C oxidase subunit IV family protein [Acidobacteriota bacterium]